VPALKKAAWFGGVLCSPRTRNNRRSCSTPHPAFSLLSATNRASGASGGKTSCSSFAKCPTQPDSRNIAICMSVSVVDQLRIGILTLVASGALYEVCKQAETILTSNACICKPTFRADESEDLAKDILESDNLAQVFVRTARQIYQQQ
jgi:hypothetical protein